MDPMSLPHALLGLLALEPSTGYEIAQRFDRSLSNAWHASHSQIYPELARLQEEGFAEVVGEGARNSRTYAVTDAGRDELRRWLLESQPNRNVRNETALRWFLIRLLDPADRRDAFARELDHTVRERAELLAVAGQIDAADIPTPPFRAILDLADRMTAVMVEWLGEQVDEASAPPPPRRRRRR